MTLGGDELREDNGNRLRHIAGNDSRQAQVSLGVSLSIPAI